METLIAGIIALLLLAYLFVAMHYPENPDRGSRGLLRQGIAAG